MARARADYELSAEDRTGRAFASVRKRLSDTGQSFQMMSGIANKALAGISVAAVATSLVRITGEIQSQAAQIEKLSRRFQAGTESLSEYQNVAKQSGVEFGQFTTAIQRMARRISQAKDGTGEAKNELKELGLSAAGLSHLDAIQQFEVLTVAMEKVSNEGNRLRILQKLFDSEGVAVAAQIMANGIEGIQRLRQEVRDAGAQVTEDLAKDSAAAEDAMDRLALSMRGTIMQTSGLRARVQQIGANVAADFLKGMKGASFANPLDFIFAGARSVASQFGDETEKAAASTAKIADEANRVRQNLAKVRSVANDAFPRAKTPLAGSNIAGFKFDKNGNLVRDTEAEEKAQKAIIDNIRNTIARVRVGLGEIADASASPAMGQFRELGMARISSQGLPSNQAQRIISPELEEQVDLLRSILQAVRGGRVAVVG